MAGLVSTAVLVYFRLVRMVGWKSDVVARVGARRSQLDATIEHVLGTRHESGT